MKVGTQNPAGSSSKAKSEWRFSIIAFTRLYVLAVVEIYSDTEEDHRPRKKTKGRITGEIIDLCQSSADECRKAPPTTPVRIREDNGVVTILSTDEEDEPDQTPIEKIRKKNIAPPITVRKARRQPSAVPDTPSTPSSRSDPGAFEAHPDEDDEAENAPIRKVKRKVITSPISSPETNGSSSTLPDARGTPSPQVNPRTPSPAPPLAPGQLQQLYTQAFQNAIPSDKGFGSTCKQGRPPKLGFKVAFMKQPADFPVLSHKFFSEESIGTLLGPKALREVRRRIRKSASVPSRSVHPEIIPQDQSLLGGEHLNLRPSSIPIEFAGCAIQASSALVSTCEGSTVAEMRVDGMDLTISHQAPDLVPPVLLPPPPALAIAPTDFNPTGSLSQSDTDISVLIDMLTEEPLEMPVDEGNSLLDMDFVYPS